MTALRWKTWNEQRAIEQPELAELAENDPINRVPPRLRNLLTTTLADAKRVFEEADAMANPLLAAHHLEVYAAQRTVWTAEAAVLRCRVHRPV